MNQEAHMNLTSRQNRMRIVALLYAVSFIITGLIFLFIPDRLLDIINMVSASVFPSLTPASDSGKFWLSMTVSMMAGISTISILIWRDVARYLHMAVPLVVMKFASALTGLSFFVAGLIVPEWGSDTLANLIVFIADFPLGVLMLFLYRRVISE